MKKLLMIAAALLLLCSCAGKESSPVRTVESYGRVYTVDTENQTITYEGVVYSFDIESSGGQGYSVRFTAPDGATSFWNEVGMGGAGGWSDDWDMDVWPSDLAKALNGGSQSARRGTGNPLLGLLLIAIGAFHALAPGTAWYLSHGWRFKDAEPSEAALFFSRAGGMVAIFIGIIFFFV